MQKRFFITAGCLVLAVLLLKSGSISIDWKDYLKGALNRTTDAVEDVFLRFKVENPKLYKSFKQQSDALQAAINEHLDAHDYKANPEDMHYLDRARNLYAQLRDKQTQMFNQAKSQLNAQDFAHLQGEFQRLENLLERFSSELNIHPGEAVTIQAMTPTPEETEAEGDPKEQPQDVQKLDTEITRDLASTIKNELWNLTQKYATREALDAFNTLEFNPTRSVKATIVDRRTSLAANEKYVIDSVANTGTRLGKVAQAQQKLFMEKVTKQDALRIGVVFSGGGYRAMTLSLGYALGLAKMGIWDAASYISTLSGSTWFLSVLMRIAEANKEKNSLEVLQKTMDHLTNKIKNNTFALVTPPTISQAMKNFANAIVSFTNNVIWPKFLFQRPFRSIDIYGGLLAQTLLSDINGDPQIFRLSDEWNTIKDGNWPFPIRTSVSMFKDDANYNYHWFEFNPVEARDVELDLALPMYSFGRSFSAGSSVNKAPETTIGEYGPEERLGLLMGTWGSAYTVNLKDLQTMILDSVKKGAIADKARAAVITELLKSFEKDYAIGAKRISPTQVNNPFKLCDKNYCPVAISPWLSQRDYLTLVDGGIAFNLPLPPLYKDLRQLDVLIVGDSSGDVSSALQLDLFMAYIKTKGINYQRIDDKKNKTLSIWKAKEKAPLIIYINFINDPNIFKYAQADLNLKALIDDYNLATFNYTKALAGYADTFNFDYTLADFTQLAGMGEFNMRVNEKVIANILRELWDKKRPKETKDEIIFGEWD